MVFDPEEVKQESDKAIQASKDALLKLENDVAGYELAIKDIRKKGREDKEKADKEAEEKEKERIAKLEALKDAEVQSDRARRLAQAKTDQEALKIKYDNERAAIRDAYFKQLQDAQGNEEAIKLIKAKYQSDLITAKLNFDKQQAEADKKAFDKMVENETKNAEIITDISKKSSEDRIKHENAVQQNKENVYKETVNLANAIIALAGEQSKTGKAIALSIIAADTATAISGALSITQKPSPDNIATGGLAGAAKYIGLAAMILTNAKKARDILKGGQASAPSGMQSSGGGMAQMAAPRVSSTLPQVNGFDQRVYVTEGDISRTQGRVASFKKVSVTQ